MPSKKRRLIFFVSFIASAMYLSVGDIPNGAMYIVLMLLTMFVDMFISETADKLLNTKSTSLAFAIMAFCLTLYNIYNEQFNEAIVSSIMVCISLLIYFFHRHKQ